MLTFQLYYYACVPLYQNINYTKQNLFYGKTTSDETSMYCNQ